MLFRSVMAPDIRVIPAQPVLGELARVTITVRNNALIAAPAAEISLIVIDPDGSATNLLGKAMTNTIPAGGSQTFSADWTAQGSAGVYTLVAGVDNQDQILEVSEANNLAFVDIRIAGQAQPQLAVTTDKPQYLAAEDLTATVVVSNPGEPFSGTLEVAIEDTAGYTVATILSEAISSLGYGDSQNVTALWNSGATFAGSYRVQARLVDDRGQERASSQAPFTLGSLSAFTSEVVTDRASYVANENVRVTANVNYANGNSVVTGANATIRILDSSAQVIAEKMQALGDLLPGATSTVTLDWNTGLRAVGPYQAVVEVTGNGVLATDTTVFTIKAGSPELSGTLTLSEQAPEAGTAQIANYSVTNKGNLALTQLPVIVSLVDPGLQATLESTRVLYDLPIAGSVSGVASFSTNALPLKTYTILLQAELTKTDGTTQLVTLKTVGFPVVDRTPPQVSLNQPAASGFFRGDAKALVFARDSLSAVKQVEISLDGAPWTAVPVHSAAESLYGQILPGLPEGAHTLVARADRKSTRLNSSHTDISRMPSSA